MSEYRNELLAARARIAHLEAIAPPAKVEPAVRIGRVLGLLGLAVPILLIFGCACAVARGHMEAPPVLEVAAPRAALAAKPPPPSDGLAWLARSWYAPAFSGPFVTAPTSDGAELVIGLAFDRARATDNLVVVAFDRASLRLAWRSPAYPGYAAREGEEHYGLVVVGERAVFADGDGELHFLDVQTGKQVLSKTLPHAPAALCTFGSGGAKRALYSVDGGWRARSPDDHDGPSLFPWEHDRTAAVLDPLTGKTTPPPIYKVCQADHYCMYRETEACRDLEQRDHAPPGRVEATVQEVWNAGDARVSLGSRGQNHENRPVAVGWTATDRLVRWETILPTIGQSVRSHSVARAAIDPSHFAFVYPTEDGPLRVVALDTKTGSRHVDLAIPGSGIGTRLHDIVTNGDDVFVTIDDELVVIDAKGGSIRGRLGSF